MCLGTTKGNGTLRVDLKAGLQQEEMKWSKLECWTLCLYRRWREVLVTKLAWRWCLAPQRKLLRFRGNARRLRPPFSPMALIAKQFRDASDCGGGRKLVELLGQEEFRPVQWVRNPSAIPLSVAARRSHISHVIVGGSQQVVIGWEDKTTA